MGVCSKCRKDKTTKHAWCTECSTEYGRKHRQDQKEAGKKFLISLLEREARKQANRQKRRENNLTTGKLCASIIS